ncbi:hypothetical protein Tco_1217192 [Tanacetum coccineum]
MTPRSCLRWKPTGRIFKTIGLRWVPTGKIFAFSTNKVDSEPPNGSKEDITNQCESESSDCHAGTLLNYRPHSSMFKRCLIAADQASVFMEMTSVHISSGLVLHQMTFDHNRSELGIQDHSNEQSSSKLVPKVVPLAVKTATSRQELELLFHHHIAMLRTTEHPSDTNVFTMKMEILLEPASNKHLYGLKRDLNGVIKIVDTTVDATPLSSRSPSIVDYKIHKEGKNKYFQIIRADGNSKNYLTFGQMFKNFNGDNLEDLWKIVKSRFMKKDPVDDMDNLLLRTLNAMFEPQNIVYYLLVEKTYPLTKNILHQLWNDVRLQVDYEVEMAYELLRKHFKTLSLDELRSPDFDLFFDQEEYSKEEVKETMVETMEQYMSKTRAEYGSGVARPKIEDKDNFELKG